MTPPKAPKPKPPKDHRMRYSPAKHARIVDLVRNGLAPYRAVQAVGISERTWWRWVARCRDLAEQAGVDPIDLDPATVKAGMDRDCVTLWQDTQQAAAECEAAQLVRIQIAANTGTWQAAAWMLERLWPDRYVKRVEVRADAMGAPDPADIVKAARGNVVRLDAARRTS